MIYRPHLITAVRHIWRTLIIIAPLPLLAAATPPPQRLARTLLPATIASIVSNAPPGARILLRYHRALPYDPGRDYQPGAVVLAPDGAAYICTAIAPPTASAKSARDEPLLRLPSSTALPPASHFRRINTPIKEATRE